MAHGKDHGAGGDGLFADLLPHTIKLRRSQGRLEQQIAMLRHVEALRLFAAGTTASYPRRWPTSRCRCPADPISGKPFEYRADGGHRPSFAVARSTWEETRNWRQRITDMIRLR